jgi:hypothetical protein
MEHFSPGRWANALIVVGLVAISGCAELGAYDPYPSGGYRDPYGDSYRYDRGDDYYSSRERDRARRARKEAEYERERLEDERERLEDERRRIDQERHRAPPPPAYQPPPREERCPSGFTPSENKCSSEERRRGCKDMRLPGGLGCVKR